MTFPLEKTLNSKMEQNEQYLRDSVLLRKLVFPFRVVVLLDISATNSTYIIHIQHSLRLLLEEQLSNKDSFNVIAYAPVPRAGGAALGRRGGAAPLAAGHRCYRAPSIPGVAVGLPDARDLVWGTE